jgi:hypothetical protein
MPWLKFDFGQRGEVLLFPFLGDPRLYALGQQIIVTGRPLAP